MLGEDGGVLREARLSCRPVPTGTHPDPVGACRALEAVRGNIGALPGEPRMCTHQYAPVTISAQGVWDSWTQAYNRTFANTCEMDASTGIVFRF
ncbi:protease inhibitor SIL-V5 [Streptomyces sp. GC420]|nr:protease inhibitor SIL-V5 [Streptomyces sp. GC420]